MSSDGDFQKDWDFQARFLKHQMEISTKALRVEVAPIEDDLKRNTDLILRSAVPLRDDRNIRISARARRRTHLSRYQGQVTIRDRRPSGVATEMDKMRLGDGDFFIYGFESQACADGCDHPAGDCRLDPWLIGNLHILRDYDAAGGYHETRKNKGPNGSQLAAFYLIDMPLGFVLDSEHVPQLDRDFPWAECRNPHWPARDGTWKPKQRVGMCAGEYVTAMSDPQTVGAGEWRKCLCCGFVWKAGWIMPISRIEVTRATAVGPP